MYGQNVTLTATVVEVQRSDEEKYKLRCDVGGELLLCSYYRPLVNHWDLTGCGNHLYCSCGETKTVWKPKNL